MRRERRKMRNDNRPWYSKLISLCVEVGLIYMVLAYIFDLPLPVQILFWTIK